MSILFLQPITTLRSYLLVSKICTQLNNYQMKAVAAIALLENGPEGLVVLLDVLQSFQTTFQSVWKIWILFFEKKIVLQFFSKTEKQFEFEGFFRNTIRLIWRLYLLQSCQVVDRLCSSERVWERRKLFGRQNVLDERR